MNEFVFGDGRKLVNVHGPEACRGRYCVIHNPSDHHMKDWPLSWRDDREEAATVAAIAGGDPESGFLVANALGAYGWFERVCSHGVGHPDPDDLAYRVECLEEVGAGVHGCDGCCKPSPRSRTKPSGGDIK